MENDRNVLALNTYGKKFPSYVKGDMTYNEELLQGNKV